MASDLKPLCISVICNEGYQEYIPYYIYFILKSYPTYEIIVYLEGNLRKEVEECLDLIKDLGKFKIKPLQYKYNKNNMQSFKSIRWILYDEEFENYDNIYIGDIDMFIVEETPSLNELHLKHAQEICLPYSNIIRPGTEKLTGLHFMRTKEYFPKVLPVIKKYSELIESSSFNDNNEAILYKILQESVGVPKLRGNFVTHHGIHMRVFTYNRTLEQYRQSNDYPFKTLFEKHYVNFFKLINQEIPDKLGKILKRISYTREHIKQYKYGGVGVNTQIGNVVNLCKRLHLQK